MIYSTEVVHRCQSTCSIPCTREVNRTPRTWRFDRIPCNVQKFKPVEIGEAHIHRQTMGRHSEPLKRTHCHSCGTPLGPSGNCPMPACIKYKRTSPWGSSADKMPLKPDWAVSNRHSNSQQPSSHADPTVRNTNNQGSYYLDEASLSHLWLLETLSSLQWRLMVKLPFSEAVAIAWDWDVGVGKLAYLSPANSQVAVRVESLLLCPRLCKKDNLGAHLDDLHVSACIQGECIHNCAEEPQAKEASGLYERCQLEVTTQMKCNCILCARHTCCYTINLNITHSAIWFLHYAT